DKKNPRFLAAGRESPLAVTRRRVHDIRYKINSFGADTRGDGPLSGKRRVGYEVSRRFKLQAAYQSTRFHLKIEIASNRADFSDAGQSSGSGAVEIRVEVNTL